MKTNIITISREFGSGGRSIAKEVAKKLGWKYYDETLVQQVAEKTGYDVGYVSDIGEHAPSKSKYAYSFASYSAPEFSGGMTMSDYIWSIQRMTILDLAEEGNCVIVGRCADSILSDRVDCLNIFIHAPLDYRAKRIVSLYGETDKKPEKRLKEKDKKRKVYYKHYTGQEWGMAKNYHMTLNSGVLTPEKCVEIITDLAKNKE